MDAAGEQLGAGGVASDAFAVADGGDRWVHAQNKTDLRNEQREKGEDKLLTTLGADVVRLHLCSSSMS